MLQDTTIRTRPAKRRAAAPLLAAPRYELLPLPGALEAGSELPVGTRVTVTSSPARGIEATVALTEALAARGLRPAPHLAARQFRDTAQLNEALDRLTHAAVADVFVVGGDDEEPKGAFPDALTLLRNISETGHHFPHVGVGSYPEGHPTIDDETLWQALADKQPFATYTVTQMCFDADALCRFTSEAAARGIALPILAGVPGVVDPARLLRVSMRIGVGDSVRFLRNNGSLLGRFLNPLGYHPKRLVRELGARVSTGECTLAGLHIYTFNQVHPTRTWVDRARQHGDEHRHLTTPGGDHE